MCDNPRDTQFQGFAKALDEEIRSVFLEQAKRVKSGIIYNSADLAASLEQLIARRAYDLVGHSCWDISNAQLRSGGICLHPRAMMREISDMTEFPKNEE